MGPTVRPTRDPTDLDPVKAPADLATSRRRMPRRQRRELILDSALELFGHHGYDSVGMRDVAAASKISAPGIYRHFPNKQAVLISLFDRLSDQLTTGIRDASRAGAAHERLVALLNFHLEQVLREPRLIPVYQRVEAFLPPVERLRDREILRAYLRAWTEPLTELRDLNADIARTTVMATFGVVNSTAYHRSTLSPRALLTDLAWRTLGTNQPHRPLTQ